MLNNQINVYMSMSRPYMIDRREQQLRLHICVMLRPFATYMWQYNIFFSSEPKRKYFGNKVVCDDLVSGMRFAKRFVIIPLASYFNACWSN